MTALLRWILWNAATVATLAVGAVLLYCLDALAPIALRCERNRDRASGELDEL